MQPLVFVFLTIVGLCFGASLIKDDPSHPQITPVAGMKRDEMVYIGTINGKSFFHGTDFRTPADAKIACEEMNAEFAKVETQRELDFIATRTTFYYPWTAGVYTPAALHDDESLVDRQLQLEGYIEDLRPRALMIQRDSSPAYFFAQDIDIESEYICMIRP